MSPTSPRSSMPEAAFVFAAGLGTRMRPLTDRLPKPLVAIDGVALLDRSLDAFAQAGVGMAIVNVHHLADQIETHLEGRQTPRIILSDEREKLLDQGGGIKKVLDRFAGRPFFICNTDAFWIGARADNLRRLAEIWNPEIMDIALLLAPRLSSVGVDWDGDFHRAADGRLTKRAAGETADFVYAGIGIVKPQLFETVEQDVFPLAPFFFRAAEQGRLFGVALDGKWLHVGTMGAIEEAESAVAEEKDRLRQVAGEG
ncbi:MurNAc alpha-1-phosphate uridylyltransferase [Methylosinus sp. sav-2]|nr:MurNAc alpha-1-phosphate uridylyltransferase [Methylosinus sp. sav-2]